MTPVPRGWRLTTLAEVAKWGSGGTPQAGNPAYYGGPIPWAVIGDLHDGQVSATRSTITMEGLLQSSAKLVPAGSVLLAMYGSIGKLGIASRELATNQAIAFAVPNEGVLPAYLFYYLLSQRRSLDGAGKGATQRNISQTILRPWPIVLPPDLAHQRRIVAILEDHLSRLDAGSGSLTKLARRARALVTSSATGALEFAGGEERSLGCLATSVKNGIFISRATSEPRGVPILRISAVRPMELDLGDLRYSERDSDDLASADALLRTGDLLFTRYNGNPDFVGACTVVPEGVEPLTYPDKLIRMRIDERHGDPRFVAVACSYGRTRQVIRSKAKTTSGQSGISGRDLKTIPIRVPSLAAQRQVVEVVNASLDAVGRLALQVGSSKRRESILRSAILAEAFSGRLGGRPTDHGTIEELVDA